MLTLLAVCGALLPLYVLLLPRSAQDVVETRFCELTDRVDCASVNTRLQLLAHPDVRRALVFVAGFFGLLLGLLVLLVARYRPFDLLSPLPMDPTPMIVVRTVIVFALCASCCLFSSPWPIAQIVRWGIGAKPSVLRMRLLGALLVPGSFLILGPLDILARFLLLGRPLLAMDHLWTVDIALHLVNEAVTLALCTAGIAVHLAWGSVGADPWARHLVGSVAWFMRLLINAERKPLNTLIKVIGACLALIAILYR